MAKGKGKDKANWDDFIKAQSQLQVKEEAKPKPKPETKD